MNVVCNKNDFKKLNIVCNNHSFHRTVRVFLKPIKLSKFKELENVVLCEIATME